MHATMDEQLARLREEGRAKRHVPPLGNAVFSADSPPSHRYLLSRLWDESRPVGMWGMMNPSVAGEIRSDNTVSGCLRWAKEWGWGGMLVVNFDSYISTDPAGLLTAPGDPTGGASNIAAWAFALELVRASNGAVVLAWGCNVDLDRARAMETMIRVYGHAPMCLQVSKDGHPKHPRGLPASLVPIPFPGYPPPPKGKL